MAGSKKPPTLALLLALSCGNTAGDVVTDGTVGPAATLAGPAYDVHAGLGTQRGGNLFHSFSRFNVAAGESAAFSGPTSVTRVLARVTGGQPSAIDGTIRCTIPDADVYLINPAGVVFGPDANLDVSGSFVVTTADVLRHADGGRFDAATPGQSVLTTAPPAAFGFLAATPAPITLRGGGTIKERPSDRIVPLAGSLTVSEGKSVLLVGGKITLDGGLAAAPGGRVDLAALASPGEVGIVPAEATEPLTVSGAAALADVVLTDAGLDTGGLGPGVVTIRGHNASMERSFIGARVFGAIDGRGIHFDLTGDLTLLDTDVASDSDGPAATGRAGDVIVKAANFTIDGRERLSDLASDSFAPGPAGDVRVDLSGDLTLVSRGGTAALSSTAVRGGGNGGSVTVNAENVLVTAKGVTNNPLPFGVLPVLRPDGTFEFQEIAALAAISAAALEAGGNAGRVEVNARNEIRVESGGVISSGSLGPGAGGGLKITARRVVVSRSESPFVTTIQTGTLFPTGGDSGDLEIQAGKLIVLDGGLVSASTIGSGNGGNVRINADRIRVEGRPAAGVTGIIATSQATGAGGDITLDAGRLVLRGGTVQSASAGSGPAGTVEIVAGRAVLRDGAAVTTSAPVSAGGSMSMTASHIELVGSQLSARAMLDGGNIVLRTPSAIGLSGSAVSASTVEGTGGKIDLDADVVGLNDSRLVANAIAGNGGNITVDASGFIQSPLSLIDASSAFGMSGSVDVTMPDMDVASSLAVLASSLVAGDARLEEKCARRLGGAASSFVRTGRGGMPLAPGGWSPSLEPQRDRRPNDFPDIAPRTLSTARAGQ